MSAPSPTGGPHPALTPTPSGDRPRSPRVPWAALGVDLLVVTLFALIGRASHAEGLTVAGTVVTAAPFLAGTVGGWAVLVGRGTPRPASLAGGALVWATTVVVGMLLRAVSGFGVAVTFVLVAVAVTGVGILGWRALGAYLLRRTAA